MSGFIVAAAQFPVFEPRSLDEYEATLRAWVKDAKTQGAELLVFPEYAALILTALFSSELRADLHGQVLALQGLRDEYRDLHRRLAQEHRVHIVAGSFPWRVEGERIVNRAHIFAPDGALGFQDKRMMTRFERESWNVNSGEALRVFETRLGRIGIDICYDSEFPLLARAQAEAGAMLLLVPSCTDTRAGYERVRIGCRARALENQVYVVQAPLIGELTWSPAIDVNVGCAAVFGPPDRGFPEDGVIAQGQYNRPAWVCATLDLGEVERVRREGQVRPFAHWVEQDGASALPAVELVDLTT